MKALMICCDKYINFAQHTIKCYNNLWKNNNFEFYVPYNEILPDFGEENIKYIKTGISFKDTIKELTKKIDDEEWIYWCSSDSYPIELDVNIYEEIKKDLNNLSDKTSVIFPGPWKYRKKIVNEENFYFENNKIKYYLTNMENKFPQYNIWIHQFMKCKVLKNLFNTFTEPPRAKQLDKQLSRPNFSFHQYMKQEKNVLTEKSYGIFGENTSRGLICPNALENMKKLKIKVPIDFEVREEELIWR